LPVDANIHSGKWNHYVNMQEESPAEAADRMLRILRTVAPRTEEGEGRRTSANLHRGAKRTVGVCTPCGVIAMPVDGTPVRTGPRARGPHRG